MIILSLSKPAPKASGTYAELIPAIIYKNLIVIFHFSQCD
jgi:hypothetical protein